MSKIIANVLKSASVVVLGLAFTTSAKAENCRKKADEALKAAGITNFTFIQADTNGTRIGGNITHWYVMPGCETTGYLEVTTTSYCMVQEVFTRFGCYAPGVNHYSF